MLSWCKLHSITVYECKGRGFPYSPQFFFYSFVTTVLQCDEPDKTCSGGSQFVGQQRFHLHHHLPLIY